MPGLADRLRQGEAGRQKADAGRNESIRKFVDSHPNFREGVYVVDFNVRTGDVGNPTSLTEVGVRTSKGSEDLGDLSSSFRFQVNTEILEKIPEGTVVQMVVLDKDGNKVAEQPFSYRVYHSDKGHTFLESTSEVGGVPVPLKVIEKRVVDTGSPGTEVAYNFIPGMKKILGT